MSNLLVGTPRTCVLRTVIMLLMLALLPLTASQAADEHAHEEDVSRGPHNGRLLSADGFTLELAIYEAGVPPQFRAWAYQEGEAVAPEDWDLSVELERLGGQEDSFEFEPEADYLMGMGVVEEPHSFDVRVNARFGGQTFNWEYESHEGRVQLSPAMAQANGIEVSQAGPHVLSQTVLLYGRIVPDPQQVSHIRARFPGLIRSIAVNLGDRVEAAETIATVEANNSLQIYEIEAPISGMVVEKHANPGEIADENPLLTIASYSQVWVDLSVFPGQAEQIEPGQAVVVHMGDRRAESRIGYLNPGEDGFPSVTARIPLENNDLKWTPGLLVEGEVTVGEVPVELAVENRALQSFRDWQVVFINIGSTFEIRPLALGRTDGRYTEVLEGLNPGDSYVVENSYLLKADLEKAGASHDH